MSDEVEFLIPSEWIDVATNEEAYELIRKDADAKRQIIEQKKASKIAADAEALRLAELETLRLLQAKYTNRSTTP